MTTALKVANLTKELGNRLVLDNITFEVEKGEIFGIIGMSGSGKTTLLSHLIGFIEPDEGEIQYHSDRVLTKGKTPGELRQLKKSMQTVKSIFGFAPQAPSFYPRLTVEENLIHFGSLHKVPMKQLQENMKKLLEMTKLDQHRNKLAEHLSGGMQRRLSIMCGMIHSPEILILDEPTADLDPVLREDMWKLIREINDMGTTIIVASHFLHEMEAMCNRIALISNGKLLKYGEVEEVKDAFTNNSAVEIKVESTPEYIKALYANIGKIYADKVHKEAERITVYTKRPKDTLLDIVNILKTKKIPVNTLEVHRPTLREVFERVARAELGQKEGELDDFRTDHS
jgi:ABC-2 type transport system ATP-binding protein